MQVKLKYYENPLNN